MKQNEPLTESEAREALQHISPDVDRDTWFSVAAALKTEFGGAGRELFQDWSQSGRSYDKRACDSTWRSASPGHYTIGTVVKLAQHGGWPGRRGELSADEKRARAREGEERRRARQAAIEADEARLQRMQAAVAQGCVKILDEHTAAAGRSPYLGHKGVGAVGVRFFTRSVVLVIDDQAERCTVHAGAAVREFFQSLPSPRPEHLSCLHMRRGDIAVPLRDAAGQLQTFQAVNAQGKKLFPKYGRKKGGFHLLGDIEAGPLGFAEGYATGATVHELTGWPVVVCIDSGNLMAVAAALLPLHPQARPVWLADNDAPNPQTGKCAGQDAAQACQARFGGTVLLPRCTLPEAA